MAFKEQSEMAPETVSNLFVEKCRSRAEEAKAAAELKQKQNNANENGGQETGQHLGSQKVANTKA